MDQEASQATLCYMVTQLPHRKGYRIAAPIFRPMHLLWPNCRPSQQLLSSCYKFSAVAEMGDRLPWSQWTWAVKREGDCCAVPLSGELGPHLTQCGLHGQRSISSGILDQSETWHGGRPGLSPHCVKWEPSSPKRGTAPNFRPCLL